jgi:hypothetical protein
MTRRQRTRRRMLWAGVLLGLVLLLATVSALRVGLWARDWFATAGHRTRPKTRIRKEKTMHLKTTLGVLAAAGALLAAAPAAADPWGADAARESNVTAMLDARERSLDVKQEAQLGARSPGWFERVAAAHSVRQPFVDDRFRLGAASTSTPSSSTTDKESEWPQIGLGVVLGVVFVAALGLAAWASSRRPYAH